MSFHVFGHQPLVECELTHAFFSTHQRIRDLNTDA